MNFSIYCIKHLIFPCFGTTVMMQRKCHTYKFMTAQMCKEQQLCHSSAQLHLFFSFKAEMQFEKLLLGFILQAIFAFVRTQNEVR